MFSSNIVLPSLFKDNAIQESVSQVGRVRLPSVDLLLGNSTPNRIPQQQYYPPRSNSISYASMDGYSTPINSSAPSPMSITTHAPTRTQSQPQLYYYAQQQQQQQQQQQRYPQQYQQQSLSNPQSPIYAPNSPGYYQYPQNPQNPQLNYQMYMETSSHHTPLPKQASAWSPSDDKLLRELKEVQKLGWREVAKYFPKRTPNACQFRWRRLVSASKSSSLKNNPNKKFDSKKSSLGYLLNGF